MTDNYRVLARRYRPQTFAEVIGQEFTVRALARAVTTNRIVHAYLFTGIRGVGKTSLARIVAKSLCCEDGPTAIPCGYCTHCTAIVADTHPDVTEVDAASKTGVEDARVIVESARYMPVSARYRIYIIDEVHMLSRGAFNALLKTLEEPPPEVVFILATTEIQKLPVTVISRCQQYNLRRVATDTLVKHYQSVVNAEGFIAEDTALRIIADAAEGSVRDGLSMLDQVMTLEGGITEATVLNMLGLADKNRLINMLEYTFNNDAAAALEEFDFLYSAGADPQAIVHDLMNLVYEATIIHVTDTPIIKFSRIVPLAKKTNIAVLVRTWQMLLKGCTEIQTAARADHALEMLLVRLATVANMPTPAEIIELTEIIHKTQLEGIVDGVH